MTIGEAYDPVARERWQPLSDAAVVGIALAAIGGAWATRWPLGLVLGVALAVRRRLRRSCTRGRGRGGSPR